ncbi:MAG: hypothetical protein WCF67_01695, partial [Chitinophagaceae bacterium]
MPFINRYPKNDASRNYFFSEEFTDDAEDFIFSAGRHFNAALISRISTKGDVEWEKLYYVQDEPDPVFVRKMIQLSRMDDGSRLRYVAYMTTGQRHYLLGLDSDGNTFWFYRIFWDAEDVNFYIEPCRTDSTFYLIISNLRFTGKGLPFAAKFDADGNFRFGQWLIKEKHEFVVDAIRSHEKGIALAGRYIENESTGLVIDLDPDLKFMQALEINAPPVQIHAIEIREPGEYLLSGHIGKEEGLFATLLKDEGGFIIYNLPNTSNHLSSLTLGAKEFYFVQRFSGNGIVFRIGWDFSVIWAKDVKLDVREPNGIDYIRYNRTTDKITFDAFTKLLGSFVGYTDEDLNSCKTVALDVPRFVERDAVAKRFEIFNKEQRIDQKGWEVGEEMIVSPKIESCPDPGDGEPVEIDENTSLQSPNFYLQAAGSTAADGSARGIHLRWTFSGVLGENHLPKGNYASTNFNFNKPHDFVKLYRTPYAKYQVTIDFSTKPAVVDDNNKVWIYRPQDKVFYVYFRNAAKYAYVRGFVDPLENPMSFIRNYGSEIIEIENKKELFFAAELHAIDVVATSSLKTESLSVAENALAVPKITTTRRTYNS